MTGQHFKPEHRVELKRIFTELTDFIRSNGITQVVGAGPSATPFLRAIGRAYFRRHGDRLSLVNFGPAGEEPFALALPHPSGTIGRLKARWPHLDLKAKTLIFDEELATGASLFSLGHFFKILGTPHKTAVVGSSWEGLYPRRADFIGHPGIDKDFHDAIHIARGAAFGISRSARRTFWEQGEKPEKIARPSEEWRARYKRFQKELREIADSIPRKQE